MDEQSEYHRPTAKPVLENGPDTDPDKEQIRAFADFIAKLLDSAFSIPGTRIRIGLDPLLGLIPGLGDIVANLIGSSILFLGTQIQIPKINNYENRINSEDRLCRNVGRKNLRS